MITYFIWEVKFIFCLNHGFSRITRIARILRSFLLVRGVTCQDQDSEVPSLIQTKNL